MKKVATILAACAILSAPVMLADSESESTDIALNRQWIDHIPDGPDDLMEVLIFVDQGYKIGLTADISEYRQHVDLVEWRLDSKDRLSFENMQDRASHKMTFKAYECSQHGFDYCMDVKLDGKTKTFYSLDGWEVGSAEEAQAQLRDFDL